MNCPACTRLLEETGRQTTAGVLCTGCSHLWVIKDGRPVALNAGNPLLTPNPAPTVEIAPAETPAEASVMTAAKAACFIRKEVG